MSDYTPSWARSADAENQTPPEEQYGGGVDFHDDEDEETRDRIRVENPNDDPSNHGEPRHPSAAIMSHGEYWEELGDFRAHRCGGEWKIVDRYDDLPSGIEEGDTPSLCIDGIRRGDSDMEKVTVSSIRLTEDGRFEIRCTYDGELPALGRWLDEGCILCQEGSE